MTDKPLDTREVLQCQWCGHTFLAKRHDARTCSATCRKAFSRWRTKIRYIDNQVEKWLDKYEQYLKFPRTQPVATRSILQRRRQIDTMLDNAKIKVVR